MITTGDSPQIAMLSLLTPLLFAPSLVSGCLPTVTPEKTTTLKPITSTTMGTTTTSTTTTTTTTIQRGGEIFGRNEFITLGRCTTCEPLINSPQPPEALTSAHYEYATNARGCKTTVNKCPEFGVLRLVTDTGNILTLGNPYTTSARKIELVCNNGQYKMADGTVITENVCYYDPCLTCPDCAPCRQR